MGTNGFREEELVSRKVKVGNEWQTRVFPVVGGRLRILHENNDHLSIQTEIVRLEPDFAVVKAAIEVEKGKFNGTGTASAQRDARLADSLVELAETRAIARALRFGGIGVEYTSAEEIAYAAGAEQTTNKPPEPVFPADGGANKQESKASNDAIDAGNNGAKPDNSGAAQSSTPQSLGNGKATQAQCRALFALTRKAQGHGSRYRLPASVR